MSGMKMRNMKGISVQYRPGFLPLMEFAAGYSFLTSRNPLL